MIEVFLVGNERLTFLVTFAGLPPLFGAAARAVFCSRRGLFSLAPQTPSSGYRGHSKAVDGEAYCGMLRAHFDRKEVTILRLGKLLRE